MCIVASVDRLGKQGRKSRLRCRLTLRSKVWAYAGARLTPVLLGLQVSEKEQLEDSTAALFAEGFVFAELPANSRSVFDRFLQ